MNNRSIPSFLQGTFHLEHSLAANSRLNREQQHLYNRAQQTTRVDPLGSRLTYGTAIQAGILTRPEAGDQPEEDYEEEGDMDELEEVEESREDYVRQFTHLPHIFRAEGESTSVCFSKNVASNYVIFRRKKRICPPTTPNLEI